MQIESRKEETSLSALARRVKAAEVIVEVAKRRRVPSRNENFLRLMKMKKISMSIKGEKTQKFSEEKLRKIKKSHLKEILPKVMPSTPHNTSQYLIHNFTKSRKENVFNLISNYTNYLEPDIEDMITEDVMTIEDLCVSGGSMMDIIISRGGPVEIEQEENDMIQLDQMEEKTNFTNFTPKETSRLSQDYSEYEEESTVDENNFFVTVKNQNQNQNENEIEDKFNNYNNYDNYSIDIYKEEHSKLIEQIQLEKISSQHREIQHLILKLRSRETINGTESKG
jgi:hypothetical protein